MFLFFFFKKKKNKKKKKKKVPCCSLKIKLENENKELPNISLHI